MVIFLLGIFIGIILGAIGILSMQAIIRTKDRRRHFKEEEILQPLVNSLEKDNIIRLNTRYSKSIKNKCVYVLIGNELKQYIYKDNNEDEYLEINTIDKPEDIENIFGKYGFTIFAEVLITSADDLI